MLPSHTQGLRGHTARSSLPAWWEKEPSQGSFYSPCPAESSAPARSQKSYEKQPSRAPVTQSHVCLTTSASSSELPHTAPTRAPIMASTPPTPAPNEMYTDLSRNTPDFLSRQKLGGSVQTASPRSRCASTKPVLTGTCSKQYYPPTEIQHLSRWQTCSLSALLTLTPTSFPATITKQWQNP